MMPHEIGLTDGELAAVKAYRAAHARAWAAFDRRHRRLLEFAELRRAGEADAAIARRYKRLSAAAVGGALAGLPAVLAAYRARPPSTLPPAARRLLAAAD